MLSREKLPQIPRAQIPAFAHYCKRNGVEFKIENVPVMKLKPIQRHLNKNKVHRMVGGKVETPLMISQEGYIVDGHHRWAAEAVKNRNSTIPCVRFMCPVTDLVALGHTFEGSFTKSV